MSDADSDGDDWGGRRPPCAGLWSTPMVQVNGDLTTCCIDDQLKNRLGNLKENTLNELWNGAQINAWRKAHIDGRFEDSGPFCTDCNWRSAGAYPKSKALAWAKKQGAPKG